MNAWLIHRRDVIRRRTKYLLRKAEERKHIVEVCASRSTTSTG